MRIFSKKSYKFETVGQKPVIVQAQSFSEVPDWVKNMRLYKWAKKEGSVSEVAHKEQESKIENEVIESEEKELREKAKTLKIPNYFNLKLDTLKIKIAEAEAKLSGNQTPPDSNGGTDNNGNTDGKDDGGEANA